MGVDGVLKLLVLGLLLFKHIAVITACVADRLEEMFEHSSEECFERGKPIEHADALGFSEPDALRAVEVRRQFIEQVVLLGGEIALIELSQTMNVSNGTP